MSTNISTPHRVLGFLIDEEKRQVLLLRPQNSAPPSCQQEYGKLWNGFQTPPSECLPSPIHPSDPTSPPTKSLFTPILGSLISIEVEHPVFSMIRITHTLTSKFIVPNHWVFLGQNQENDQPEQFIFVGSYPLNLIKSLDPRFETVIRSLDDFTSHFPSENSEDIDEIAYTILHHLSLL